MSVASLGVTSGTISPERAPQAAALVRKVRDSVVVGNKAAFVAIGLRVDGTRELLGLWLEAYEGATFWPRVLSELRARGLADVLILCRDSLEG